MPLNVIPLHEEDLAEAKVILVGHFSPGGRAQGTTYGLFHKDQVEEALKHCREHLQKMGCKEPLVEAVSYQDFISDMETCLGYAKDDALAKWQAEHPGQSPDEIVEE